MIIVDGGACKGAFFRQYIGKAKIYAFEPFPVNFDNLIKQFGGTQDLHIKRLALGGDNEVAKPLYRRKNNTPYGYDGSSLFRDKNNVDEETFSEVDIIKLSDFWSNSIREDVDILKLDIEGAEYDVLEDLMGTGIINRFKHVILEEHSGKCIPSLIARKEEIMPKFHSEFTGKFTKWH